MKAEQLQEYLGYLTHERQLSHRTIEEYKRDLSAYIIWCSENDVYPLEAVPNDARTYIRLLAVNGRAKTSLSRSISSLKSFYKWAMRDGHAKQDAAYYLISPKIPEQLPVYLNVGECAQLLSTLADGETIRDIQRRTSIKILYYCGLRAKEFTTLTLSRIERDTEGVPIRIKVVGKRNKERHLPIPEPMQEDFKQWIEHRQNLKDYNYSRNFKRTAEYIHSPFVFPSPKGEELSYKAVEKVVKSSCKKAGIEKAITPHKLRHTFATNLLRRGVPITSVSESLGHADISTTTIYAHVERQQMEDHIHGSHQKPEAN